MFIFASLKGHTQYWSGLDCPASSTSVVIIEKSALSLSFKVVSHLFDLDVHSISVCANKEQFRVVLRSIKVAF